MSAGDTRQLGLLHSYPALAGLTDGERRDVIASITGSRTSKGISQEQFELVMAEFELLLWDRVETGAVPDPRKCTVCGRWMKQINGPLGECPEGCESRRVGAWQTRYWRSRLVEDSRASSRQIWMLRRMWGLLSDMLPADKRSDAYLAAMITVAERKPGRTHADLMRGNNLAWDLLTANECRLGIDAVKDRLHFAAR
jgi:hypothetical protein